MNHRNLPAHLVSMVLVFGGAGIAQSQELVGTGRWASLNAVAWTGTMWCAVGDSGRITLSDNGSHWTERTSGTSASLTALAASGSQLAAVGAQWIGSGSGAARSLAPTVSIGRTASVGIRSTDGSSWSTFAMDSSFGVPKSVSWSGSKFRVFFRTSTQCTGGETLQVCSASAPPVRISSDGTTWSTLAFPDSGSEIAALARSGSNLLAVSDLAGGHVIKSPDDSNWTLLGVSPVPSLSGLVWADSEWIATSRNGWIGVSKDGTGWVQVGQSLGFGSFESIARSAGWTVVVGGGGMLAASADNRSWFRIPSGTSCALHSVAGHDSLLLAVGDSGIAVRMPVSALASAATSIRRRASPTFEVSPERMLLPWTSGTWHGRFVELDGRTAWSFDAAGGVEFSVDRERLHRGLWLIRLQDNDRNLVQTVILP